MAFPGSPTNGQIYNDYMYNSTKSAWIHGRQILSGTISPFGSSVAPDGYLLCDGTAKSRSNYANLFAVIGTDYGVGDGSTTFNIPDLRGVFLRGAGEHGSMTKADGSAFNGGSVGDGNNDKMQRIYGTFNAMVVSGSKTGVGALGYGSNINGKYNGGSSGAQGSLILDSANSTVEGGSRTGNETAPANVAVNYIIKT